MHGACSGDPIANFGIAAVELVHGERIEQFALFVNDAVQYLLIKRLINDKMAQATGGDDGYFLV